MAWTSPKTWAAGDVWTAADANTYIRDNTAWLKSSLVFQYATHTSDINIQTTFKNVYADTVTKPSGWTTYDAYPFGSIRASTTMNLLQFASGYYLVSSMRWRDGSTDIGFYGSATWTTGGTSASGTDLLLGTMFAVGERTGRSADFTLNSWTGIDEGYDNAITCRTSDLVVVKVRAA